MKILYFVKFGPDISHLWESKPFDKLKDAQDFAKNLPPTPIGHERPFVIERHKYSKSNVYGDTVSISKVETLND